MDNTKIINTLSTSRFSTYLYASKKHTGNEDEQLALKLYEWNATVSSHYLLPLHVFEVFLRNLVSEAIENRYGKDWPVDPQFNYTLKRYEKAELESTVKKQKHYRDANQVIPELKFYWFEHLLTKKQDVRLWKHRNFLEKAFPHSPYETAEELRQELRERSTLIRNFRNRCAHHEPIFYHQHVLKIYEYIDEIISWRCADTRSWLNQIEKITPLIKEPVV